MLWTFNKCHIFGYLINYPILNKVASYNYRVFRPKPLTNHYAFALLYYALVKYLDAKGSRLAARFRFLELF